MTCKDYITIAEGLANGYHIAQRNVARGSSMYRVNKACFQAVADQVIIQLASDNKNFDPYKFAKYLREIAGN